MQRSSGSLLAPRPNRTGAVFWKASRGQLPERRAPTGRLDNEEASCKGARQLRAARTGKTRAALRKDVCGSEHMSTGDLHVPTAPQAVSCLEQDESRDPANHLQRKTACCGAVVLMAPASGLRHLLTAPANKRWLNRASCRADCATPQGSVKFKIDF